MLTFPEQRVLSFPELQGLSIAELEHLSQREDRLDEFIDKLRLVQKLNITVEDMISKNEELASGYYLLHWAQTFCSWFHSVAFQGKVYPG